ncbi:MAG: ABC transporter permease, partial [Rhizobiales bacterium]|nr:ABC transporter permease [Hyphomicrobiales bacterium]
MPDGGTRRLSAILGSQSLALLLVLFVLVAFFSLMRPDAFPRIANILNMATDASILLVLAVGGTYVILTGGIDLSINGVLVFSGVIAAHAMVWTGGDNPPTLLVGLVFAMLAGAAWGAVNGFLIAKARIPALIVTLGTMGMSLGSALLITRGIDISDVPDSLVVGIGSGRLMGVPVLVIVTAVIVIA